MRAFKGGDLTGPDPVDRGKKGAKIKHLVAKYGTRIRTPNVDQEPVFVIKGKRADVYRVKQEIMSAAAHFLRIEQGKRQKLDSVMNSTGKHYSPSNPTVHTS